MRQVEHMWWHRLQHKSGFAHPCKICRDLAQAPLPHSNHHTTTTAQGTLECRHLVGRVWEAMAENVHLATDVTQSSMSDPPERSHTANRCSDCCCCYHSTYHHGSDYLAYKDPICHRKTMLSELPAMLVKDARRMRQCSDTNLEKRTRKIIVTCYSNTHATLQ